MKRSLQYVGSVKDIYRREDGKLDLVFSDRYSVFDWGEMPDAIAQKGEALAYMGQFFFEHLGNPKTWQNWTLPSHLRSQFKASIYQSQLIRELSFEGMPHHFQTKPDARSITVAPVYVPNPNELGTYMTRPSDTLVPLEVIFRFGMPKGSSFLERVNDASYRESLGLNKSYKENEFFDIPVVEFFTKLEDSDRFLTYQQAKQLAGLTQAELRELILTTQILGCELKNFFTSLGIELWDGKFEFGFTERPTRRSFQLVDSVGPDELRLKYRNHRLSKEFLRQQYKATTWFQTLEETKKNYPSDWKSHMKSKGATPPKLSSAPIEMFQHMYLGLCNEIARKTGGERPFSSHFQLNRLGEDL